MKSGRLLHALARLAIAATLSVGCGRGGFSFWTEELSACWPHCSDHVANVTPWGEYAASLDVPECPPSPFPALVVDTTSSELDGGETLTDPALAGPQLSFREAVTIATNRVGANTILFDANAFPVNAPGRIEISNDAPTPQAIWNPTCIDGRHRGVIIKSVNDSLLFPCVNCDLDMFNFSSMVVGIVFENFNGTVYLTSPASQMAGCRMDSQYIGVRPNGGAIVGPGNVFSGIWVIDVSAGTQDQYEATVRDNFFGHDPITHQALPDNVIPGISFEAAAILEGNVFTALRLEGNRNAMTPAGPLAVPVIVRHNFFGVDADGKPFGSSQFSGVQFWTTTDIPLTFGPDNTVQGANGPALSIWDAGQVEISKNSITRNFQGMVFFSDTETPVSPPIAAPTITGSDAGHVEGTCATPGRVEVFSDTGAQGETYLGSIDCDGVSPWSFSGAIPTGRNVTATLTTVSAQTSAFSNALWVP